MPTIGGWNSKCYDNFFTKFEFWIINFIVKFPTFACCCLTLQVFIEMEDCQNGPKNILNNGINSTKPF